MNFLLLITIASGRNLAKFLLVLRSNKMSFVTRDYAKLANGSPLLLLWEHCNSMVHSIDKDIVASIIYTTIATKIWKDLSQRFSFNQGTIIYQLQKEMSNLS